MSELSSSPVSTSTTCPYCGVGCGVKVEQGIDGAVTVSPDQKHPANLGRLCSKGMALGDTLDNPQRLLYPEIEGEQVSWDTASSEVAQRFNSISKRAWPGSRCLLCLRSIADRRLLCCQQANERIHWLGEHRYQLAVMYVIRSGGTQASVW